MSMNGVLNTALREPLDGSPAFSWGSVNKCTNTYSKSDSTDHSSNLYVLVIVFLLTICAM